MTEIKNMSDLKKYSTRDLYLFCRSIHEIERMREYAQKHFDKDKSDYNMHGFFMELSADCLRYREILERLDVSSQLIAGEPALVLITTIETQKEEIELKNGMIDGLTQVVEDKSTYAAQQYWNWLLGKGKDDLESENESLKAITELKNEMLQDAEKRISAVIETRDKLQDANDIAIKALVEIAEFTASVTIEDKCKSTLSKIEGLQNGTP